jgi:hypothetical protein
MKMFDFLIVEDSSTIYTTFPIRTVFIEKLKIIIQDSLLALSGIKKMPLNTINYLSH